MSPEVEQDDRLISAPVFGPESEPLLALTIYDFPKAAAWPRYPALRLLGLGDHGTPHRAPWWSPAQPVLMGPNRRPAAARTRAFLETSSDSRVARLGLPEIRLAPFAKGTDTFAMRARAIGRSIALPTAGRFNVSFATAPSRSNSSGISSLKCASTSTLEAKRATEQSCRRQ
jgi:hypothetical protein